VFRRILASFLVLVLLLCAAVPVCAELPPSERHDEEGGSSVTPDSGSDSSATSNSMYVYTANGKTLHLRQKSSSSAKILREIPWGSRVTVLKVSGSWAKVTYDGTTGYVVRKYLVSSRPSRQLLKSITQRREEKARQAEEAKQKKEEEAQEKERLAEVDKTLDTSTLLVLSIPQDVSVSPEAPATDAAMYSKASLTSKVLRRHAEDTHLIVLAENADWAKVYDGEHNQEGYMLLSDLVYDLIDEEELEE